MRRPPRVTRSVLLLALSTTAWAAAPSPIEFNRDVRPILSDTCFKCHGRDKAAREAELRLDLPEDAVKPHGDDHLIPIVPGNLSKSEAWRRINSTDPDELMPPPESHLVLTPKQKETIGHWIEQGAKYQPHWAFLPISHPPLPAVKHTSWPRNEIDYFILARLESENLEPSPEADKRSLLRRVTLDLTGLPPTPAEVDAFISDISSTAYEKVVDRLLASPSYGERMAVDWLDASRYADTHGFNNDSIRFMWRWRDWVIDSFNSNKPYNTFLTEQLAGDLLPAPSGVEGPNPTLDQKIASAFNRNHVMNSEVGIIDEEYRIEYAVDRTTTAGTVFMGLTIGCARCHDHKFDPITQKEFYQLLAYFNSLDEKGQSPATVDPEPLLKAPTKEQQHSLAAIAAELAPLEASRQARITLAEQTQPQWEPQLRKSHHSATTKPAPTTQSLLTYLPLDTIPPAPIKIIGKPTPTPGKIAGALQFDGTSALNLGKDTANFERTDKFSLSAWINPSTQDPGTIIARMDDASADRGFDLLINKGKPEAHLINAWPANSIRVESKQPLSPNQWHHLVATYDGFSKAAGLKLYADGIPLDTTPTNDSLTSSIKTPTPLLIARRSAGTSFKGALDDIRIYSRTLSPNEIQNLYGLDPLHEILTLDSATRTPAQQAALRDHYLKTSDPEYQSLTTKIDTLHDQQAKLNASIPTVMVMQEMSPPRKTFVLKRGAYNAPADQVFPGVPAFLPPSPKTLPPTAWD